MRYTTDRCGNVVVDHGLGHVGLGATDQGLGIIVRPIGWRSSYVFRPYAYQQPYYWYQPTYQYDSACPVAVALTPEQTAAVRAGQVVTVAVRNQCGQIVNVTVQGSTPAGASSVSGLGATKDVMRQNCVDSGGFLRVKSSAGAETIQCCWKTKKGTTCGKASIIISDSSAIGSLGDDTKLGPVVMSSECSCRNNRKCCPVKILGYPTGEFCYDSSDCGGSFFRNIIG